MTNLNMKGKITTKTYIIPENLQHLLYECTEDELLEFLYECDLLEDYEPKSYHEAYFTSYDIPYDIPYDI